MGETPRFTCPECGCCHFASSSIHHGIRITNDAVLICLSCKRWWAIQSAVDEYTQIRPLTAYLNDNGYQPGERYAR